ncbi:MAG: protein-L-isoaspartate(D-aspartate) O-methyltransferase [bacterium]|nr:protein-L-isoaspartate(D-aspartate) O-methyltransferase [bacterium]
MDGEDKNKLTRDDFALNRRFMVETQIKPRGISDKRILEVMEEIPRHLFVDKKYWPSAYADHPLPIGEEQTISQPYIVALMTEKLDLSGREKVLEIGTGSGYQTAILSKLAKEVYTVERFGGLALNAKTVHAKLGLENIFYKTGDGSLGWAEFAPFDRIIITAASPDAPVGLFNQLGENGCMLVPVGARFSQVLTRITKDSKGQMIQEGICGCVFVPLIGDNGWKGDFNA